MLQSNQISKTCPISSTSMGRIYPYGSLSHQRLLESWETASAGERDVPINDRQGSWPMHGDVQGSAEYTMHPRKNAWNSGYLDITKYSEKFDMFDFRPVVNGLPFTLLSVVQQMLEQVQNLYVSQLDQLRAQLTNLWKIIEGAEESDCMCSFICNNLASKHLKAY